MSVDPLFKPHRLGELTLPNRFVMAPLTRGRASPEGVPGELAVEYYRQRATAGLIVTEATSISPQARGWVGAPGIYTDAQVAGWRAVTEAVHRVGGRIVLQLWHMGRVSHPDFQGGALPVGPSAIAASGDSHTPTGHKPYVVPRALETSEIAGVVSDYAAAARRARDAGFDGVEIHGANGYLVDQFLRDGSNKRTDAYGGSVERRLRFLREVTEAVVGAWSASRTGVRLSPVGSFNDMRDSDPAATFGGAARLLRELGVGYLHAVEGLEGSFMYVPHPERISPIMRKAFSAGAAAGAGTFVVNGGYTAERAARALVEDEADLVAFGVPFLANPDLVRRVREGAALNTPDFATFYTPGAKGYTDYPALAKR